MYREHAMHAIQSKFKLNYNFQYCTGDKQIENYFTEQDHIIIVPVSERNDLYILTEQRNCEILILLLMQI